VAVKLSEVLESWLLQEKSLEQTVAAMTTPTEADQDHSGRRRVPAAEEYEIMVTVVNPEPEKLRLNWDLPEAVQGNFIVVTFATYLPDLNNRLSLLRQQYCNMFSNR
jgi:hypothetical protein